jgi:hypothetical protein
MNKQQDAPLCYLSTPTTEVDARKNATLIHNKNGTLQMKTLLLWIKDVKYHVKYNYFY